MWWAKLSEDVTNRDRRQDETCDEKNENRDIQTAVASTDPFSLRTCLVKHQILISWKLSLPGRHLMFIIYLMFIITEYIPKLIEHVDIIDVGTKTRSGVVAIVNKLP